jgi:hypothetical protein
MNFLHKNKTAGDSGIGNRFQFGSMWSLSDSLNCLQNGIFEAEPNRFSFESSEENVVCDKEGYNREYFNDQKFAMVSDFLERRTKSVEYGMRKYGKSNLDPDEFQLMSDLYQIRIADYLMERKLQISSNMEFAASFVTAETAISQIDSMVRDQIKKVINCLNSFSYCYKIIEK